MADDPTIEVPPPQLWECPTCGKNNLPGENECSLCGTSLLSDAVAPTVSMPPPPLLPREVPAKPTHSSESSIPLSPPPQLQTSSSVPLVAPFPTPLPPTKTVPFLWLKLIGGACVFMLLGGLVDRIVFQREVTPVASLSTEMSSELQKESTESPVLSPPPGGQVVVATDLLPIQIFGIQENEKTAAIVAFREQLEAALPGLRNMYGSRLTEKAYMPGTLVLELAVNSAGQVADVRTYTTGIGSADLRQTVQNVAKGWRFLITQDPGWKLFCVLLLTPLHNEPMTLVSYAKEVWPGQYKVLAATPVPVYQTASENALEVGRIKPGLRVYVISSQQGWLGVLSPRGEVGYVRREMIFPRVEHSLDVESKN